MNPSINIPTLIHNIYDNELSFLHSLTVDGVEGLRVHYKDIARNGIFCAVTPYYNDYFPEVFMTMDFTSVAHKQTHRDCYTGRKQAIKRLAQSTVI